MSLNYFVSAKKATSVTDALVGNFTGEDDLNLILAKNNRIHIHTVSADGLKSVQELSLYGRICATKLFRPKGETLDSLAILTQKFNLAILGWDSKTNQIVTRAAGSVADRVGRISDFGLIMTVHKSGLIGLRIYDGTLKVVQWADNKDLQCFNARFEDIHIVDLCFITRIGDGTRLCYISQDSTGRHLKTVELNLVDKELKLVAKQDNIETASSMVIPIPAPYGGVVVVGQETLLYSRDDNTFLSTSPPSMNQTQFTCFAPIDQNGQRFLLGDDRGRLFMLILDVDDQAQSVRDAKVEFLGETSIASCLVYLDNAVVYVGSIFGDCQLIRLNTEPNPDGLFVTVLETYTNIAPIRDMVVIETEGQTQLVTCSGAFKDGSLRIIRNGIGIEEAASVDLPGVKRMWPLRVGSDLDNYLVVSFVDDTHILMINGEELEDTSLLELTTSEQTLWVGCLAGSETVLQLTPSGARLTKPGAPMVQWTPSSNLSLVAVNDHAGQIVAASGNTIYYLKVDSENYSIDEIGSRLMQYEISCIDVSSFKDKSPSNFLSVGYWKDLSAAVLTLPDLQEVTKERVPGETLPRSVLLTRMDKIFYLLVALGDGSLYYYVFDQLNKKLLEPKKANLGTQPPSLHRFFSRGETHVFACSDRPAVIFSSNDKLVFSNVNLKLVTQICSLNSAVYRDSLVMSDGETICIGTVDDIQKLHIRSVPLGESVRRVAHQAETSTLAILVHRDTTIERMTISQMATAQTKSSPKSGVRATASTSVNEIHSLVVLDMNTFQALHCHEFASNEHAISLLSAKFGEDGSAGVYYIVGTAMVYMDETEPKTGRILVFEVGQGVDRSKLRLVSEKEVKGAPYSMAQFNKNRIVISLNSALRMFEWTVDKDLRLECSQFNRIAIIQVKVKGDQVLSADLMSSMTLSTFKPMEGTLEEAATDNRGIWMLATEFIDAETLLGSETHGNLYTCEVDRENPDDKLRLKESGQIYLGELVNVFRRGCLVASHADSQLPVDKPIMYGTAEGAIGLIVQLPAEHHKFLSQVELKVAKHTENCLRIGHKTYRQYYVPKTSDKPYGFIDGDLVESVLEWPRNRVRDVFSDFNLPESFASNGGDPSEEVLKIIEDISRIH